MVVHNDVFHLLICRLELGGRHTPVMDGVFVNRGVMDGPWLPVYGSGVPIHDAYRTTSSVEYDIGHVRYS